MGRRIKGGESRYTQGGGEKLDYLGIAASADADKWWRLICRVFAEPWYAASSDPP